jgi:4-amino-4-deoxy-L-arabinose transferase-like glycosyltransferase
VVQFILFASLAIPLRALRLRAFKAFDRKGRKEFPQSSQRTKSTEKLHRSRFPEKLLESSATAYSLTVLGLLRKHAWFFLGATLAGLALRLLWVVYFPAVVDDSRVYADIANNWLQHGVYGITDSGQVAPTLSRLPGYPAFLAAIFAIFGTNNFHAVLLIQILFDLATCLLIADLARHLFSDRAAKAAFLLAALCPFLANYAAAALTETLEIFFTTLALNLAIRGLLHIREGLRFKSRAARIWLGCGLSVGACILLRPDGGILYATIAVYLLLLLLRQLTAAPSARPLIVPVRPIFAAGLLLTLGAFAPLVPWTLRNLHTLHQFQPLAPRYATEADESVMTGFNRWTKTWMADYTSVQEVYWKVPGDAIEVARLPRRAFDSAEQRERTAQLFADYNQHHEVTPEIDAGFGALAEARIHSNPLRYYAGLPALRIADMWLRPRTELLPSDPRWWEFDDEPIWRAVSIAFLLINLAYVAAAAVALLRSRAIFGIGLFVLFLALRSLFLGMLENPEPRYTLECYPVVVLAAASLFIARSNRTNGKLGGTNSAM